MIAILALAALEAIGPVGATTISGTVRDSSGGLVPGATVIVRTSSGVERRTFTGPDGRFTISIDDESVLIVRAGGFAEKEQHVSPEPAPADLDITLAPATLTESVTVTPSRTAGGSDAPVAATVLRSATLDAMATPMLDDQLKSVPGFSLFRRSSSRVANPTTQGVTMRGLSASGASRSLVLADGVPLNDPFGGWVYWDRIPQAALDRVEVVHGATGDVYGADAVGGVIQVFTISPSRLTARVAADVASHDTPRLSLFAGASHDAWSGFVSGEWQRSDGFLIIAPEQQGPVDTPAAASYGTVYANVGYSTPVWRATARGNVFEESRQNGTPLTTNNTASRQLVGDVSGSAGASVWLVRGYGGTQGYDQSFSAVNAARTFETLTQRQHVPSKNAGATGQWSVFTRRASWMFGADVRRIEGESDERTFNPSGVQTGQTHLGGIEWDAGAFARVELRPADDWTIVGTVRGDRWSLDPNNGTPDRDVNQLSPKVGAAWRASSDVTVHALVTRAFRAPTLNELFRNFRVGNTLTTANANLEPETLTGAEGGATIRHGPAELRFIGFWNRLDQAVTNLTISSTAVLITRQRTNAGTIRAAGAEIQGEWQIVRSVRASGGIELVSSVFSESAEPGLAGNRVPQVPHVQGSAALRVDAPWSILATLQLRANSSQFDDDRNQFLLSPATVVDVLASRSMGHGVQLFGTIENLFDDEYDVGRTPTRTIGLPRTARVGIKAYLGK